MTRIPTILLALPCIAAAQGFDPNTIVEIKHRWVEEIGKTAARVQFTSKLAHNPYREFEGQSPIIASYQMQYQFFLTPNFEFQRINKRPDMWRIQSRSFE